VCFKERKRDEKILNTNGNASFVPQPNELGDLSAGLMMWKEHTRSSETVSAAAALSNCPQ
jgi:hypothetical protein